jgi:two-component system cell cycle response regulator
MTGVRRRSVLITEITAGIALVAFVIHTLVPDGATVSHFFDYRVYYALVAVAAGLTIARATLSPINRGAWIALAAAVTSYATAEFLWLFLYNDATNPPYPSIADAFYLGFYPASYIGLMLLLRARLRSLTPGVWVDGVTAALAIGAVGSAVIVEVVLTTLDGPASTVITNLAYPLCDVILLSLVFGGFAVTGWRPGRAWAVLGASLAVSALADSYYLYATATGTYTAGTFLDAAWPTGLLLIAVAAWQDDGTDRVVDVRGRTMLVVPAICAVIGISLLVVDHFHRLNLLAVSLATLALAGVLTRLALTFRENRILLRRTTDESVTDALTGLGNRRRLMADLDAVTAALGSSGSWVLAIFDLDGFKGYNDAFGHPAGDALLARLGQKLGLVPAGEGHCYRLGGDEFCLLAPADAARTGALIDASQAALTEHGDGFAVTSSFGAVLLPDEVLEGIDALRTADERLYAQKRAKRTGREQPHEALLLALFEHEPSLHDHLHGVTELAAEVGRRLGISGTVLEELERAAMLHDIGKLAIPAEILVKPEPLDESEWAYVRQHTVVGERIAAATPGLRNVARIVRWSHERWDGTGYPDGLTGEEIPLAARIVFACDAFSAMTTTRSYRAATSPSEAVAELERGAGTQFDPAVVAVVARVVEEARHTLAA